MPQNIEYVSSNGSNVFVASNTTSSISIAVDYRAVLSNIANSLFSISVGIQNTNAILTNTNVILSNTNTILSNTNTILLDTNIILSGIEQDINTIKTLGNTGGVGYKTTTPFGWIGQSALYQLYIEQGYALSNSYVVNAATQEAALERLRQSVQLMKDNLDEDL